MKRVKILLFLVFSCVFLINALPAEAGVEKCTYGNETNVFDCQKCSGNWFIFQGESKTNEFYGHFLDFTNDATVSGSKVSVNIKKTRNGATNASRGQGMIGSVKLKFTATSDAETGKRTVTLKRIGGEDTFKLRVLPRAWVQGHSVAPLEGPFSEAIVTIRGKGLQNPWLQKVEFYIHPNHPIVDDNGVRYPDNSHPRITGKQILRTSSTETQIKLTFSTSLKEATVDIYLTGKNACDPLRAPSSVWGHLRRVKLKAVPYPYSRDNLVDSIEFKTSDSNPSRTSFEIGERFFARVHFKRPGKRCLITPATRGSRSGVQPPLSFPVHPAAGCEYFYWRMIQPNDFQEVQPTKYNSNTKNKLLIPSDNNKIDLHIVASVNPPHCPPVRGETRQCRVWMETWVQDPNTTRPPKYKKVEFFLNIPPQGN